MRGSKRNNMRDAEKQVIVVRGRVEPAERRGPPVNVSSIHRSQCSLLQAVMQLVALPPVEQRHVKGI